MAIEWLQLRCKFHYGEYCDFGPLYLLKNIEMAVIGNNILSISGNCTIDKLIVIYILLYQAEMNVCFLRVSGMQSCDSFHYVTGYLPGGLLRKDFLILNQYLCVDT